MTAVASSATTAPPERRRSKWLFPLLWAAFTVVMVLTVRDLPWDRAIAEARHVRIVWLIAAVLANALILPLWAAEWRLLVPGVFAVGYRRMLEVVSVTAAVLNTVPFFAGEASGVALLIGRAGLTRGAALSVLAMDQLLVGFAKLAIIAAALLYVPLPGWLRAGLLSLIAGVAAMLVILIPLALRWTTLRDWLVSRPTTVRTQAARLIGWGQHLEALREPRRTWRLAALALAKKGAELAAVIAIQLAFGLEPTPGGALLVVAALAVTTLIPATPANLGVYEATVFAVYRSLGISAELAVGMAILQHLCFLLPALATGYGILTVRQLPPTRRDAA